jgi:hypothetical protein
MEIQSVFAAGLLGAGSSVAGLVIADATGVTGYAGALIGGACGLMSVAIKGWLDYRKRRMELEFTEREALRQIHKYRRKLRELGVEPDSLTEPYHQVKQ